MRNLCCANILIVPLRIKIEKSYVGLIVKILRMRTRKFETIFAVISESNPCCYQGGLKTPYDLRCDVNFGLYQQVLCVPHFVCLKIGFIVYCYCIVLFENPKLLLHYVIYRHLLSQCCTVCLSFAPCVSRSYPRLKMHHLGEEKPTTRAVCVDAFRALCAQCAFLLGQMISISLLG